MAIAPSTHTRRPNQSKARSPKRMKSDSSLIITLFVALISAGLTLGPILYLGLGGFRSNAQIAQDPTGLPDPWNFDHYIKILTQSNFWEYTLNSTIVAIATTLGVVMFGTMAAYPLAWYKFRGSG